MLLFSILRSLSSGFVHAIVLEIRYKCEDNRDSFGLILEEVPDFCELNLVRSSLSEINDDDGSDLKLHATDVSNNFLCALFIVKA